MSKCLACFFGGNECQCITLKCTHPWNKSAIFFLKKVQFDKFMSQGLLIDTNDTVTGRLCGFFQGGSFNVIVLLVYCKGLLKGTVNNVVFLF